MDDGAREENEEAERPRAEKSSATDLSPNNALIEMHGPPKRARAFHSRRFDTRAHTHTRTALTTPTHTQGEGGARSKGRPVALDRSSNPKQKSILGPKIDPFPPLFAHTRVTTRPSKQVRAGGGEPPSIASHWGVDAAARSSSASRCQRAGGHGMCGVPGARSWGIGRGVVGTYPICSPTEPNPARGTFPFPLATQQATLIQWHIGLWILDWIAPPAACHTLWGRWLVIDRLIAGRAALDPSVASTTDRPIDPPLLGVWGL